MSTKPTPLPERATLRDYFWLLISIPVFAALLWFGSVLVGGVKVRPVPAETVDERIA